MLPIRADKESLSALALGAADLHIDLSQSLGLAGLDAGNFPSHLRIESQRLLQEAIDLIFGGQVGGGMGAELVGGFPLRGGLLLGVCDDAERQERQDHYLITHVLLDPDGRLERLLHKLSFAPLGLVQFPSFTQGLRPGLHSTAALRLLLRGSVYYFFLRYSFP